MYVEQDVGDVVKLSCEKKYGMSSFYLMHCGSDLAHHEVDRLCPPSFFVFFFPSLCPTCVFRCPSMRICCGGKSLGEGARRLVAALQ